MKISHRIGATSACLFTLGFITTANAATISWSGATDTTSASDISTVGSLVKAFNSGGASTTVNGVTFSTFGTSGDDIYNSFDTVFSPPGTNNVFDDLADLGALDLLLSTANFLGTPNGTHTIALDGLTAGINYELQLFFTDQRGSITSLPAGCVGCNDREVTFTSGANSVTLEADPGNDSAAPYGQFTLGFFTADAASQTFTISGVEVQQVNAWQLRTSAIPVPAAVWLFSSGLVGLISIAKRKQA